MPKFVAVEHWYADAGSFGEAMTAYDNGLFVSGGYVDILEVREDGKFYTSEGEVVNNE